MGQANSRSELLWQLSGYGNKEKVKELLAGGLADPNWVSLDDNSTALMVAAGSKKGDEEMIGLLLSAGADVTMRDNRENTALHHAAMRGVMQVIKALVDAGSEIDAQNKQGWTPLMNACYWCQPDAVAVFIELGAKVDVVNKEQRSALHELCRSPTEHYMCKAETEVDEDDSSIVSLPSPVTTPIDTESSPKDAGVSADADALPDSELSPTDGTQSITTTGRAPRPTMEERRAERERKEVKARERNEKLKAMEPALLERREEELAEITCLLLEAGCQPDRRSQSYGEEDFTPLLYAAFHNHAQIALVLTQFEEKNVDVNYQGGDNEWTALHWAVDRGNKEMVQLLLDAGADPWRRGFRGDMPIDRAKDDQIRTILLNAQNSSADSGTGSTEPPDRIIDTSSQ